MGNEESFPEQHEHDTDQGPMASFPYCSLFFVRGDKVKLAYGDQQLRDMLAKVCQRFISIARTKIEGYVMTVKADGYPFEQTTQDQAIAVRQFTSDLLRECYAHGWLLLASSNLARKDSVTALFFRKATPEYPRQPIVVVGLSSTDKIQLINADDDLCGSLSKAAARANGLQDVRHAEGATILKLDGYPWEDAVGMAKLQARNLILSFFLVLERAGYCYYGSCDVKGTADSMFFMRGRDISTLQSHYMMMTLDDVDKLRLINTTPAITSAVHRTLHGCWQYGLQRAEAYAHTDYCFEFKLAGTPWHSSGEEAVMARLALIRIFDALSAEGYKILATLNMSRKPTDKSGFLLRSVAGGTRMPQVRHICVSLSSDDKMRLLNFPPDLIEVAVRAVMTHWPLGISQRQESYCGSHQLKLNGRPWEGETGSGGWDGGTQAAIVMMTGLLQALEACGWRLVSSADVSAKVTREKSGGRRETFCDDVDSWFLARAVDEPQPGPPATFDPSAPYYDGKGDSPRPQPSAPAGMGEASCPPPPSYSEALDEKPPEYKIGFNV